jgi:tetratricopeptide (TPR) repeat protein
MYVVGLLLVPIGMLCKPTAMVAPLVAAAIDWCVLRRPLRRVVVATIPYLLAAVPLAVVAKRVQPATAVLLPPAWQRPALAGSSIAFYLYKFAVPTRLAFDYDWRPMKMWAEPWFVPTGVATLAVLLILFLVGKRRWPWVAAAVLVFVAALLPVLGLTRFTMQYFSTVSDHYLTLALLAPALLLARLVVAASRRSASMAIISLACVAWFAWLGTLTVRQIGYWHTPEEISRHTIAVTPDSSLAHNTLGEWLEHKGRWGDAEQEFLKAARSNDRFFSPLIALARLYAKEGRADDAIEATEWLMEVHDRYPPNARPDYSRFIPEAIIPDALQSGHIADVPRYKEEQGKLFPAMAATAPSTTRP